jgi:hypothetical protein
VNQIVDVAGRRDGGAEGTAGVDATTSPAPMQLEPDRAEAERFIATLAGSADAVVTFQAFHDAEKGRLKRVLHGSLAQHWAALVNLNRRGAGIFLMVNEGDGLVHEGEKTCRTASNVRALRALFVDDDEGALTPTALELTPSIIVQSRRGIHAYWKLRKGELLHRFEAGQVGVALALGVPDEVKDLPRVMRLPGFFHQKEADPFFVRILQTSDAEYSIDEILEGHGASAPAPRLPRPVPVRAIGHGRGYGAGALRSAVGKVLAAPEGQRNKTLNDEAFSLGQLVADGVIARGEAEAALEAAAIESGLSASETRGTIRSGLHAGEKVPRGGPGRDGGAPAQGEEAPPAPAGAAPAAALELAPLTDTGNAERLVRRHGGDLRFVHPWGKWLVWDGTRWKADSTAEVDRRAKDTIRAIAGEAAEEPDGDRRKAILKHAIASESMKKRREMIEGAKSEVGIPVEPHQLDADQMLLNVRNGTLGATAGRLFSTASWAAAPT